MKQFSILNFILYAILFWFSISFITSLYSLYKVETEIKKLKDEIEKYKIGYIIYKSRTR